MNTPPDDEGERLKAAEIEAAKRYYAALAKADLSEMNVAAGAWTRSRDALSEFLEALYPYHSSG
jgi:hypothetical protein